MSKLGEYIEDTLDNRGKNPQYDRSGKYPVIDNFMIQNNYHPSIVEATRYINQNIYETFIRDYVKRDEVIMTLVGNGIGNVALMPSSNAVIVQNTIGFRTKDSLDDIFLYYYFKYIQKSVKALDRGSSQPSIKKADILELDVTIPDIVLQKKIANVLAVLDSKIERNNEINFELEAIAKTIYSYWFLQFDFPNASGKPYKSSGGKMVWNEELKREIPEGWEVKQLDKIFDFIKGKIPDELFEKSSSDRVSYLTIDAVNGGTMQYCKRENMVAVSGEVIMVMDGAASSDVYVGKHGALGSTFCKLEIKKNYIEDNFLYVVLKTMEVVFKRVNTGSTVPHANKKYIGDYKVCMPGTLSERKKLQAQICKVIDKIIANKKENEELASLRDFLLPLLMNGQVGFKEK